MKISLCNLKSPVFIGHDYVFDCEAGEIHVAFFPKNTIRVEYIFKGHPTPAPQTEARGIMCCGEASLVPLQAEAAETDGAYELRLNELLVRVSALDGTVTVLKDGRVIHGGRSGTGDTVLPQSPVRLILDGARQYGRWLFPLDAADEFYGLGDKSGVPDRRGRSFRMFNRDALGYSAEYSDPLYKSVPFFIKSNPVSGVRCGLFFPDSLVDYVDFGRESRFAYTIGVDGGPFAYYVFAGDSESGILDAYYDVTGRPCLPPLHSFGYLGSSMNYVEPDDAMDRITRFFDTVEEKRLPCEGMYMSSGFLKHPDGKRYTFVWNREKFPDPKAFVSGLRERGYRLIMNIKPGFLTSHPLYGELAEKGCFIKNSDGSPYTEYYWGGSASFPDFSVPEAAEWWKGQLKEQFFDMGCAGIWNDNNELEMEDSEHGWYAKRLIYPLLMCRASCEAARELEPGKRPWIYSRSGTAGLQRYARTWSGDNTSEPETTKYNQYMSRSLALSGIPFCGHDLGGFSGPEPSPETLYYACRSGVFQCRFVIHSWRENGVPTEPWTFPELEGDISEFIRLHYYFLPYIYATAYEAVKYGTPPERCLHLADPGIPSDCPDCMFGGSIMKLNSAPKGEAFYRILPGTAVPVCPRTDIMNSSQLFEELDILITPAESSPSAPADCIVFADDGESDLELGRYTELHVRVGVDHAEIEKTALNFTGTKIIRLVLPEGYMFPSGARKLEFGSFADLPDRIDFIPVRQP